MFYFGLPGFHLHIPATRSPTCNKSNCFTTTNEDIHFGFNQRHMIITVRGFDLYYDDYGYNFRTYNFRT